MSTESAVRIALVYPTLLGTYGDGGNVTVLAQRLRWRGVPAETIVVDPDETVPSSCDLYVLGGGEDSAQTLAAQRMRVDYALNTAVDAGAAVLAICAGLQVLGNTYLGPGGTPVQGLGLLDVDTDRLEERAVGELLVEPAPQYGIAALTGYENHGGRTWLGRHASPLGQVLHGVGNGTTDGKGQPAEGAVQGRVLGTYLHGPCLARNPDVADLLLSWVLGAPPPPLAVPEVDELRAERLRRVRPDGEVDDNAAGRRRLLRR